MSQSLRRSSVRLRRIRQFRRFLLRGLEKVTLEFSLVAIAHNFMKLWLRIMIKLKNNRHFCI
ncbi:MAG: transposase [Candidatus Marinimicrobia bacterium]|nr:transposase [Candidatus Neomarinimicrobiota bacterium]